MGKYKLSNCTIDGLGHCSQEIISARVPCSLLKSCLQVSSALLALGSGTTQEQLGRCHGEHFKGCASVKGGALQAPIVRETMPS